MWWPLAVALLFAFGTANAQSCGFSSCEKVDENLLNIHIVPHTHDDVGWLKTVDQYYYGSRNDIQQAGVQYIISGVVTELAKDAARKFTYVEIAYFYRWWLEQNEATKSLVKKLVSNGQLQFTVGGWCMADEASTHYVSLIDEHTLGFRFLSENFGECGRPLAAWQIDPFGHSRELANLFAQFGFNGLYLGRIDYQDRQVRWADKQMEVVWSGSDDFSSATKGQSGDHDMFTGVTPSGYGPIDGFCWDDFCGDDPIMDDPRLHDYNVEQRVQQFLTEVKGLALGYTTNNVMLTMGSDFQWQNAYKWFVNLDKLIMYVNAKTNQSGVRAFYSTPACYTYAVNQASKKYSVKTDDFFPYADKPHGFWTGYFTSRAALKGYVREAESYLQTFRQMHMFAKLGQTDKTELNLFVLEEALGLAQHHDAVSGTEKQHVAYDYAQRIQAGLDACTNNLVQKAYDRWLPLDKSQSAPAQTYCAYLNVSVCDVATKNKEQVVTLYNSNAQSVTYNLRLPAASGKAVVYNSVGGVVESAIVAVSNSTKKLWKYMIGGGIAVQEVQYELVFETNLPGLGWSSYYIAYSDSDSDGDADSNSDWNSQSSSSSSSISSSDSDSKSESESESESDWLADGQSSEDDDALKTDGSEKQWMKAEDSLVIENAAYSLEFDSSTGLMTSATSKRTGVTVELTPSLKFYAAMDTSGVNVPSGAYIFRPANQSAIDIGAATIEYYKSSVVQEVRQTFADWATLTTRLYTSSNAIEIEWTVGPIPVGDNLGREVVLFYESNLDNNGTCYTDANGRQMLKRVRNYRPTWQLYQTENVSGNYYPINSRIYLRDNAGKYQLTVLTDRTQGGGCIQDGTLEIMLHRRLLHDDYLGVGEPLNEPGLDGHGLIVRGKHLVILDTVEESGALHRWYGQQMFTKPLVTVASSSLSYVDYARKYRMSYSALATGKQLPKNVNLLNIAYWRNLSNEHVMQALLRFEHLYQHSEDEELSKSVTFEFDNLFGELQLESFETLTLGANQNVRDAVRLKWNVDNADENDNENEKEKEDSSEWKSSKWSGSRPLKYRTRRGVDRSNDGWEITLTPMEIRTLLVNVTAV